MSGDVLFYSHMDDIDGTLSEGSLVTRGQFLGTIGIS